MARLLPRLERYHRPSSVEEATALLRERGSSALLLGGGVSLGMIPRPWVTDVVSIEGLGLEWVEGGSSLRIGGGMRLGPLAQRLDPEVPAGRLLRLTISRTATTPLRNLMTVGGVIGGAGPWSDLPVALLALGAQVVLEGEHAVRLEDYLSLRPSRRAGILITEVRVPTHAARAGAFLKIGRNETDLAMVSAAAVREDGCWRVAIGGAVARPRLVPLDEATLSHGLADPDMLAGRLKLMVRLRSDPRADEEYRLVALATCILDCVREAGDGG